MHRGFVKLWRKSMDSRVWKNRDLWKVWCWCLMKASHHERWVSVTTGRGTMEVKVGVGQFIFGRRRAATELQMKESTVYVRMKKLEKAGNLDMQPNRHYSLVSVCNWELYAMAEPKADGTEMGGLPTANLDDRTTELTKAQNPDTQPDTQYTGISAADTGTYATADAPTQQPTQQRGNSQLTAKQQPCNNEVTQTRKEENVENVENGREEARAPDELDALIDGWNSLPDTVAKGTTSRTAAVEAGWRRVQRDPEARGGFENIDAVLAAIREAKFLHGQQWFRLTWLLTRGQQDAEWRITKLREGAYKNGGQDQHSKGRPDGTYGKAQDAGKPGRGTF